MTAYLTAVVAAQAFESEEHVVDAVVANSTGCESAEDVAIHADLESLALSMTEAALEEPLSSGLV